MPKKRTLRFTPEASQRLAKSVGYTGPIDGSPAAMKEYGEFLQKHPDAGGLEADAGWDVFVADRLVDAPHLHQPHSSSVSRCAQATAEDRQRRDRNLWRYSRRANVFAISQRVESLRAGR